MCAVEPKNARYRIQPHIHSLLDLPLVKYIRNFWHPSGPVPAKELALGWNLVRLVESPPHDVAELVCSFVLFDGVSTRSIQIQLSVTAERKYPVFADVRAAVAAKLPRHTILLSVGLGCSVFVLEAVKGDFGGKAIVGSECPSAAVAVAEGCARVVG